MAQNNFVLFNIGSIEYLIHKIIEREYKKFNIKYQNDFTTTLLKNEIKCEKK